MDKEQMKMAILKQEQIFRQQVQELHRLYHVQRQLMRQTQTTTASRAPGIVGADAKPQLDISHNVKPANPPQFLSFSISNRAPAPAPEPPEECSLELTLATGPSSSSSSSDAGRQKAKRVKSSSNSDSGTTAVSSTSTDSELAQFREVDVTAAVRFPGEGRRLDEMGQGAWMYQCLTLKTA